MRLFIAINLPDAVKDSLESAVKTLRRQGVKANWSRRENFHLTLAFLGELESAEPAITAMEQVRARKFSLRFTDSGRFRREGGDIFWLGVAQSEPLMELQAELHQALRREGLRLERRPYRPHLTLARRLRDRGETVLTQSLPDAVPVRGISLMRSDRVEGKVQYTELYWRELEG